MFQEKLQVRDDVGKQQFCAACGAAALRYFAKYCSVCGKRMGEGYEPLDAIRASYNLRGNVPIEPVLFHEESRSLFEQDKNTISQTAWACVVYSMVPYLGILFLPFAFAVGGAGYIVSIRQPDRGGRRLALICVVLSVVILGIQILLWWLLYLIPEVGF
ncbi:MAG TPA: hypothetical protein VL325_11090 [Pyrinomonadaceae bacterium]|nr:hypothetical protein [Pyrinomonadaceae bacterium]